LGGWASWVTACAAASRSRPDHRSVRADSRRPDASSCRSATAGFPVPTSPRDVRRPRARSIPFFLRVLGDPHRIGTRREVTTARACVRASHEAEPAIRGRQPELLASRSHSLAKWAVRRAGYILTDGVTRPSPIGITRGAPSRPGPCPMLDHRAGPDDACQRSANGSPRGLRSGPITADSLVTFGRVRKTRPAPRLRPSGADPGERPRPGRGPPRLGPCVSDPPPATTPGEPVPARQARDQGFRPLVR
jgi:hypothetical protein